MKQGLYEKGQVGDMNAPYADSNLGKKQILSSPVCSFRYDCAEKSAEMNAEKSVKTLHSLLCAVLCTV